MGRNCWNRDGSCTPSSSRVCLSPAEGATEALRQAACAGACLAEPACESANYKDATKRCSLYSGKINGGTNPGSEQSIANYVNLPRLAPQDCVWNWTAWSSCSSACEGERGQPQRYRLQNVTLQPSCGGLACPALQKEFSACTICPAGSRVASDGITCEQCPTGYAGNDGTCTTCPASFVADAARLSCVM